MSTIYKDIAFLVKNQFPQIYREGGNDFITFVEEYYKWLQQEDYILDQSRSLFEYDDIDTTPDRFLESFKAKYMYGLPEKILGNQRLFQKHILELYRAKGSDAGLALLFRLLFNEDVAKYIPSYDIFKTSDNTWVQDRYLEVTFTSEFFNYHNQIITGSDSGTRAIVEKIEHKNIAGENTYIIVVSNKTGKFVIGESLLSEGVNPINAVRVKGSVGKIIDINSSAGFEVGDVIIEKDKPVSNFKAVVIDTKKSNGVIEFTLLSGGTYYSMDAEINITTGSNTSGNGANFIIGGLSNTSFIEVDDELLLPYANINLNATAYGFPSSPSANVSSFIIDCLDIETIEVGTIESIITTNAGEDYDGAVAVSIIDPHTSSMNIISPGGYGGSDAVVVGKAILGEGVVSQLGILSTGYNYANNQFISLENTSNTTLDISGTIVLDDIGYNEGSFLNTKSFLSADKYLFDGYYYQNYSYVIKSSRPADLYREYIEKIIHPTGNILFGEIFLKGLIGLNIEQEGSFVFQRETDEEIDLPGVFDDEDWDVDEGDTYLEIIINDLPDA